MNSNKIVIESAQILAAYEAHGDECISINFDVMRKFKQYAQYADIDIKLADGSVKPIRYWKLTNDGVVLGSRIRKPEQRKYEAIRMGFPLCDDDGNENENIKALKVLCDAFKSKMERLKREGFFTDEERESRKQPDGTYRPVHLISTKIVTPMQTTVMDRETGEITDMENPFFWLSVPKKREYKNSADKLKPSVILEDKFYADEIGQPDLARPVMSHEYAPTFYNIDDFTHHPRTGKKTYHLLGEKDLESDEVKFDNTNIQDYITRNSAMIGNLKFEMAVSGRQCKLDVSLYGRFYVKVAEKTEGTSAQDDENIGEFANRYAHISAPTTEATITNDDFDFDEEE